MKNGSAPAHLHGIKAGDEKKRNGLGGGLRGHCRFEASRNDQSYLMANQIGHQFRQPLGSPPCPSVLDYKVPPLHVAALLETPSKRTQEIRSAAGRRVGAIEEATHRRRPLLRPRRNWPRRHCAAEQRDELAPPHHSITSSAATSRPAGTVRPSAVAVLMLMAVSNLVGC